MPAQPLTFASLGGLPWLVAFVVLTGLLALGIQAHARRAERRSQGLRPAPRRTSRRLRGRALAAR